MIRYSANGGFNDTYLYVKYPDFAGNGKTQAIKAQVGVVPSLAAPVSRFVRPVASIPDFAAFVGWPTDDKARAMFREQPRGERSISDFAGGVAEQQTQPTDLLGNGRACARGDERRSLICNPHIRGLQTLGKAAGANPAVASNSIQGRWG